MRTNTFPFRLTALIVAAAMFTAPLLPTAAIAQTETAAVDPPARVGRVARMSGTVSYHGAEQTQWEPATLNFPVTSGSSFWTEPRSGADLDVAGARIVLNEGTHFDIDQLTDHAMTATVAQGAVYISARGMQQGDTIQVRTPRGTVTLAQDGQYEVAAGDTERPTTVSVIGGQAQVAGDNVSLFVASNQTAQISGNGPFQGRVGPLAASPFLTSHLAPVRPMPTGDYAPPALVQQMTGGEALAETGRWERSSEYGQVWYPPVQAGWVPYRHGHWAYVAPWGWTWIDEAPWGFAPFHYGRWIQIGPSWAWTPIVPGVAIGFGYRPVYSPALVGFVGLAAGVAIGAALSRSVGWYPLGPREVYYPPYRTSTAYVRNVNVTNVTNVTNITNITNNNAPAPASVNRGATTVVPASTMTASQPVARSVQPVPASSLSQIQPVRAPAVQPTSATVGVTPAVARSMNLPAASPGATTPRPVAPGPAVQPAATGSAVPLRPSGVTSAPAPAAPRPGAPQATPLPSAPQAAAPQNAAPRPTPSAPSAPGPAITPRSQALPGAAAPLPQLRPTPAPAAPIPGAASPAVPSPAAPAPGAVAAPRAPAPSPAPSAAPQPQVVRPTPSQPAMPQAAAPAPVAPQRAPAPVPQAAAPAPVMPRAAPTPAPAPQPQFSAPAPRPAAPAPQYSPPVQHAAPPVQHYAPPAPQPHIQHYSPPAPQPQHFSAPAPQPARPAPAAKSCPPGRPSC